MAQDIRQEVEKIGAAYTDAVAKHDAAAVQALYSKDGIQVIDGSRGLRLLHTGVRQDKVIHSVGAQGSMRARYIDPETGYVTINNVYAE